VDVLALMGPVYVSQKNASKAVECFRGALSSPHSSEFHSGNLRFELAAALEASGDFGKALFHYQRVMDANPEFQDVKERVLRLSAQVSPSVDDDAVKSQDSIEKNLNLTARNHRVGYV
jgi:tetratricopeptide (TPR) repeat protein